MTGSKSFFMDSSAWIKYLLLGGEEIKQLVEGGESLLFTSVLSIFEVHRHLVRLGKKEPELSGLVSFIEENSIIVPVSRDTALKASLNSIKYNLSSVDSMIFSSMGGAEETFITFDSDFKGLANVLLLRS